MWRGVVLAGTLAAAVCAPAASGAAPEGWRPAVRDAERWADGRAGDISFAVRTERRLYGRRVDRDVPSASVIKAMLLAVYLRRPDVRARALRDDERRSLAPMIRRSDNAAASRVRDLVGNARIARFARRVGMTRFAVHPAWGYSRVTAADQTLLFLRFDRWLPRRHRAYGMRLLRTIVPRQRWGIARVAPAGWRLYFKGGWGDGSGSVNHQAALLRRGALRVSVAVMTTGNPSRAYGAATLRGVARRLVRGLAAVARDAVRGSRSRCGRRP